MSTKAVVDDGLITGSGEQAGTGLTGAASSSEAAAAWSQPEEYVDELCTGGRALPAGGGSDALHAGVDTEDTLAADGGLQYAEPGALLEKMVGITPTSDSSIKSTPVRLLPGGAFLQLRTDESRAAALRLLTISVQVDSGRQASTLNAEAEANPRSWVSNAVALCQRALEFSDSRVRACAAQLLAACMLGAKAGQPEEAGSVLSRQLGKVDRVADDVVKAALGDLTWLIQGCTSSVPTVSLVCGRLLGEAASFAVVASAVPVPLEGTDGAAAADSFSEGSGSARERLIDVVQTILRLAGAQGSVSTIADDAKRAGALRALGHVLRGTTSRQASPAPIPGRSTSLDSTGSPASPLLPPSLRAACIATLLEATSSTDDAQAESACRSLADVLMTGSLALEAGSVTAADLEKLSEGGDAGPAGGPPDEGWTRSAFCVRLLQLSLQRRPPVARASDGGEGRGSGTSSKTKGKQPKYPVAQAAIACLG